MGSKDITSLNKTILSKLSIDELESRLRMEEIDVRTEMWTGCDCVDYRCTCCPDCTPQDGCLTYCCGFKGVW